MHLHCFNPTVNKVVETLFDCAIFVFSLVGNSLISIIVFKSRAMRKPINFLIVNMAMSDLLFAIFVVPPNLVGMHFQTSFLVEPQGEVLCKLVEFMIHVSASVSVQSLVLIAVDRFGAVVYPLRPPLITSKLCCFLIVATWIISFGIYSPYFLGSHLVMYPDGILLCQTLYREVLNEVFVSFTYDTVVLTLFRCIPLVLIAIVYIVIYLKLKRQKIPGERSTNNGDQLRKRERNVLKMSIAIVLAFAICLLPLSIFKIVVNYVPIVRSCGWDHFELTCYVLANSNCAVNPCICFIFSRNYCQGLKSLLSCFSAEQRANQVQINRAELPRLLNCGDSLAEPREERKVQEDENL